MKCSCKLDLWINILVWILEKMKEEGNYFIPTKF